MIPLLVCLLCFGCAGRLATPAASTTGTSVAPSAEAPRGTTSPEGASFSPTEDGEWFSCGDLRCRTGKSAKDLVGWVLATKEPLVVGFGEAHTPASATVPPTVARFRTELLPALAGESSAIVVELLAPASGCSKATERTDETAREVTTGQAETNQSDYLALGSESRRLGVVPDILRASCDDLQAIADAGDVAVLVMMETIARLSATTIEAYLARTKPGRPRVLAYGGMLHNDSTPREERKTWSYGPELERVTEARYVEIDLVVPELVGDEALWSKFDFAAALDAVTARPVEEFVLIERSPKSYALVWPGTRVR